MSSSGSFRMSINSAAIYRPPRDNLVSFRIFAHRKVSAFALAIFFPGGNAGLHRAHVAVATVAGATDRANDNIVDDQREAAGYQNDLAFHQAQRAVKAL